LQIGCYSVVSTPYAAPLPATPRAEARKTEAPFRIEKGRPGAEDRAADSAVRAEKGRARKKNRAAVRESQEKIRAEARHAKDEDGNAHSPLRAKERNSPRRRGALHPILD